MKKLLLALALVSPSVFAMTGAIIDEPVPNVDCTTQMTFGNTETRAYDLNLKNVAYAASRMGDMWTIKGKTTATGGKLNMYINGTNGKGNIKYFAPNGELYGTGTIQCGKL